MSSPRPWQASSPGQSRPASSATRVIRPGTSRRSWAFSRWPYYHHYLRRKDDLSREALASSGRRLDLFAHNVTTPWDGRLDARPPPLAPAIIGCTPTRELRSLLQERCEQCTLSFFL